MHKQLFASPVKMETGKNSRLTAKWFVTPGQRVLGPQAIHLCVRY